MKIKLTQEQSDEIIAKMLVKDYKRLAKRGEQEDAHLLCAMDTLIKGYYLSPSEYDDFANSVVF